MKLHIKEAIVAATVCGSLLLLLACTRPGPITFEPDPKPWKLVNPHDGAYVECDSVQVVPGYWLGYSCDVLGSKSNIILPYKEVAFAHQEVE